jgi:hypothetical protein
MKKDARHSPDRLISGKRRKKAAPPGVAVRAIEVDGVEYTWSVRYGWQRQERGIRRISLSVSLHPARTRELVLDLAVALGPEDPAPTDAGLAEALPAAIREAQEAGWDPESRGRAFRYETTRAF